MRGLAVTVAGLAALLAGCGAGTGSPTGAAPAPVTASAVQSPEPLASLSLSSIPVAPFNPGAATLAARRTDSTLVFGVAGLTPLSDQACSRPITSKTVYEQAHTQVFAADGTTEAEQQEVAEYAEAAVLELRTRLALHSSTGLGMDRKVQVCVQPQRVGAQAAAVSLLKYSDSPPAGYGGFILIQAPQSYFSGAISRGSIAQGYQQRFQDVYRRTLVHEAMHLVEFFRTGLLFDQWLTEGMARYMEFGKSAHSRAEILALVAAQNPLSVAWPESGLRTGLAGNDGYFAAAAVLAYLLSPEGANNSLATWLALLDRNRADTAAFVKKCQVVDLPADCPASEAAFEEVRSQFFVAAFEAVMKERDGTPMRLRSGPNNLRDTLPARLGAFW